MNRDPGSIKSDVIVVGAGVIGLSIAYDLTQRGARVTVIDRAEPGQGCSYGNAGWITPCFSMPLPQPGMMLKSLFWLLDPDSPLYIKPTPTWNFISWLLQFVSHMNQKHLEKSVRALTEISKFSLQAYREFNLKFPDQIGFNQNGN